MAVKFSSAAAARGATGSQSDRRAGARLRTADFDALYRRGTRQSTPHFLVLARRNKLARARFGISVKSALGGAVLRNRIKRRIRALLEASANLEGWDIVVQPRSAEVARADFAALEAELRSSLAALTKR